MSRLPDETLENAISVYKTCVENAVEYDDDCEYNPILDKATVNFLEELKEYRDLEEQGRLIKLPCKVGDTVYSVECNEIKEFIVSDFDVCMKGIYAYQGYTFIGERGFSVFATKEEAEKALEVMGE